jgi:hypothetical protein
MESITLLCVFKIENKSYFEYSYIIKMEEKKCGRPANPIIYTHAKYNGKEYTVMKIQHHDGYIHSVIDTEDFDKIKDHPWHYTSNAYVSRTIRVDGSFKALYIHNLVMGRLEQTGKGSKESIDHINRNGLDNRKENLRLITQTDQNLNQKRKERTIVLPVDSGIKTDDIPKHIWYIKPNGHHGDRFGIDLKTENIKWKTTSAKNVSLNEKLQSAKEKLQELYTLYPYLNPDNEDRAEEIDTLTKSYNEIIKIEST